MHQHIQQSLLFHVSKQPLQLSFLAHWQPADRLLNWWSPAGVSVVLHSFSATQLVIFSKDVCVLVKSTLSYCLATLQHIPLV